LHTHRTLVIGLGLLVAVVCPLTALAQTTSSESLASQILVMWLPLVVVVAAWILLMRRFGMAKLFSQLNRVEEKLDRVIALMQESKRDSAA
jgi:ABC-type spermidine/putrescine transport system permease subunit I